MDAFTLGARALLIVVFGAAAIAKLSAPSRSRTTFREFGAGARAARLGAVLLPPAELAVAIALTMEPAVRWAAIAAMALLVVFIAGIGNALIQGRTPDCGCFGEIRPVPIGPSTLARNGLLFVIAVVLAIAGPRPPVDHWLDPRAAGLLGLLAVVIVAGSVLALRSTGPAREPELPRRVHRGPAAGAIAPEFALNGLLGGTYTLGSLYQAGRPVVLVFTSTGCPACMSTLNQIGRWQAIFMGRQLRIVIIGAGDTEKTRRICDGIPIEDLLIDPTADVHRVYEIRATPAAVAVAPDGTISSRVAVGQDAIEDLIRFTLRKFDPTYEAWSLTASAA